MILITSSKLAAAIKGLHQKTATAIVKNEAPDAFVS